MRRCAGGFQDVLPFWSTVGRDRPGFGFVEHLDPAARPADVPYKRVRVQARRIFVFPAPTRSDGQGARSGDRRS